MIAVSARRSFSSSRSRDAVSGAWSSRCFAGVSSTVAAATRYDTTDGSSGRSVPGRQRALARARQPLLVLAEGPQHALGQRARASSPGSSGSSSSSAVRNGPDASTDSSRTRVVPVASTSKRAVGAAPGCVAASATQPTAWKALTGSSPKPAAGPRSGSGGLVRHAGGGGRDLVAVADGDDGEPARLVLGSLQQFAHHGAIALLEDVQRQHEPREQHRVQREEGEAHGGHSPKPRACDAPRAHHPCRRYCAPQQPGRARRHRRGEDPAQQDQRRAAHCQPPRRLPVRRPGRDRSPAAADPGRTARRSSPDARRLDRRRLVCVEKSTEPAAHSTAIHTAARPGPVAVGHRPVLEVRPTACAASGSVSRRRRCLASSTSRASASSPLLRSTVASRLVRLRVRTRGSPPPPTPAAARAGRGRAGRGSRRRSRPSPARRAPASSPPCRQVDDLRAGQHDPAALRPLPEEAQLRASGSGAATAPGRLHDEPGLLEVDRVAEPPVVQPHPALALEALDPGAARPGCARCRTGEWRRWSRGVADARPGSGTACAPRSAAGRSARGGPYGLRSRLPRRLSETPICRAAQAQLAVATPSSRPGGPGRRSSRPPMIERPCGRGGPSVWLSSRSVPMCASVSRMPSWTRQRGRCRSPSVCSRAASSRGHRAVHQAQRW